MVEGNGPPSSRSIQALAADTLPLWQQTEGFEFFYRGLRPYEHYLPVSRGLEDLYAAVRWAKDNPGATAAAAAAGQEFARRYLNAEFADTYLHALLSEYAGLLQFKPKLTPEYQQLGLRVVQLAALQNSTGGRCERLSGWPRLP